MSDAWEKAIGLADMHGTVASVSFYPPDVESDASFVALTLTTGSARISASPTPAAMRQIAAALLDAADHVEESPV